MSSSQNSKQPNQFENQFLEVLDILFSIKDRIGIRSPTLFYGLEKLVYLYIENQNEINILLQKYELEIKEILEIIVEHGVSAANWKIENCTFGLKDQCALTYFLLKKEGDLPGMSGNFKTRERVREVLLMWKNLTVS